MSTEVRTQTTTDFDEIRTHHVQYRAPLPDRVEDLRRIIGRSEGSESSKVGAPLNYRHVAAVHSKLRTSCLSHDSTTTPSFLGFRNLMVLVLSMFTDSASSEFCRVSADCARDSRLESTIDN